MGRNGAGKKGGRRKEDRGAGKEDKLVDRKTAKWMNGWVNGWMGGWKVDVWISDVWICVCIMYICMYRLWVGA